MPPVRETEQHAQVGIASGAPLLDLVGVRRAYERGRVLALDGIDLSIRTGETLSVIGRSGSGKSTLLNLIAGLDQPTMGSVRFRGHEVHGQAAWTRLRAREIGIVFQSFNLLPTLNALQNVMVPMLGVEPSAGKRRARAESLLAQVGLAERAQHRPTELSGGERQRVAIARSLANAPSLMLADEPTGNLDSDTAASVLDLVFAAAASAGAALVLITHDSEIAARPPRRIELRDGRIIRDSGRAPNGVPA